MRVEAEVTRLKSHTMIFRQAIGSGEYGEIALDVDSVIGTGDIVINIEPREKGGDAEPGQYIVSLRSIIEAVLMGHLEGWPDGEEGEA